MLIQILPGLIMFAITLAFVTLFFIPVTAFKQKNELIRFYWVGVWVFLAMIAAFSGGSETLKLFHYDAGNVPVALLTSLTVCFVLFVMFGWFRLSFSAILAGVKYWIEKRKTA
ncbi:MAG: hypothetical protein ABJO36_08540 [Litorimonas sp.]